MALREYRKKRDFKVTREPKPVRKSSKGAPLFVIQKHAASRLHYDFRLEWGGTLRSWAVPKGPPYDHEEKRLAMQVEDHPLDYARFEGIIPQGEYGGGTVMVWDIGTWEPLADDPGAALAAGKIHFLLHGKKLQGEWRLVRMHGSRQGDRENEWLLVRCGEGMRRISAKRDDESVLTRRTLKQIAAQKDAEWHSNRPEKKAAAPKARAKKPSVEDMRRRFIEPMKAKLVEKPPHGDWLFEVKWDGYRAIGIKDGGEALLISRNGNALTAKFPEAAAALRQLPCERAVVDGEIVALDAQGRSSFQLLQDYQLDAKKPPLRYYVFDLLSLEGEEMMRLPLEKRRERLAGLLEKAVEPLAASPSLDAGYEELLAQVRKLGLEGLIGKKRDSRYEPGGRSGAWIKIKVLNEQEFVIGGYSDPGGSRKYFGALLIGYQEKGKLVFACKVGTGYSHAVLKAVYERLQPLRTEACPFANLPTQRSGRWGHGITRAEMKRCHWVEPRLVCQLRFTEWTNDGGLRHPVFLGLREDKSAAEVVRERRK